MSAPASRASPIRATSVAKGMDRPRIAAASQASTNCSKRSPTLLTRAMPISKNGQATTIPIRSTYSRSNTPSVASQTAATPLGHASPGKSRSARPRDPPRPSPDGYAEVHHADLESRSHDADGAHDLAAHRVLLLAEYVLDTGAHLRARRVRRLLAL